MSATPTPTIEQRIAALEAKAAAEVKTFWTWLQANIVHIAGYASIVAAVKKFF
jgi:hypothetical protein